AMPQPSGWPDFGFGWGHPKSRKFLPVSASCRNAMSVSTGADFRLTIASIRHMSAQLVPDFPEEGNPLRAVFLGLEAFRPLAVDDSQDSAAPAGRRDDHVKGIRCRGKHGHDFGDIAQGPQDVDRVGVLHEYDEEVTRSDREGVPRSELLQGLVVAFHPDECGPRSLAERNSEFDPGDGPDECLVDVLGRPAPPSGSRPPRADTAAPAAGARRAAARLAGDGPRGDSWSGATGLLSSAGGRQRKVALAADGGEEVFDGYRKNRVIRLRD